MAELSGIASCGNFFKFYSKWRSSPKAFHRLAFPYKNFLRRRDKK